MADLLMTIRGYPVRAWANDLMNFARVTSAERSSKSSQMKALSLARLGNLEITALTKEPEETRQTEQLFVDGQQVVAGRNIFLRWDYHFAGLPAFYIEGYFDPTNRAASQFTETRDTFADENENIVGIKREAFDGLTWMW